MCGWGGGGSTIAHIAYRLLPCGRGTAEAGKNERGGGGGRGLVAGGWGGGVRGEADGFAMRNVRLSRPGLKENRAEDVEKSARKLRNCANVLSRVLHWVFLSTFIQNK